MIPGPKYASCLACRLELLKAALDADDETVVGSEPSDDDKDYTRGLAQRAVDPEFKERKAKGPYLVRDHVLPVICTP